MVLESLITPLKAERRPWEMLFLGFLYSSVALFISTQIFDRMAGLIAVFLSVMASLPLIYNTIKLEEQKDILGYSERTLLKEHSKAISFFVFLFIGMMLSFIIWYVFLPPNTVDVVFSIQKDTIRSINSNDVSGAATSFGELFSKIFFNNLKVLIFCILFAFFFGAGAIFILTWNASVIAVAIGGYIRSRLSDVAELAGIPAAAAYFKVFSLGLLRYTLHGIPEIIAYFIAGLAGGIISIAVIKHDFRSKNFEKVLLDSVNLLLIALGVLFIAALLEVFVTPAFMDLF